MLKILPSHLSKINIHSSYRLIHKLSKVEDLIQLEEKYSAHNYHPLPVVLSKVRSNKFMLQ